MLQPNASQKQNQLMVMMTAAAEKSKSGKRE